MRFLYIADPVHLLKKQSDTTLCFLRETLARGLEAHWAIDTDITFQSHKVLVRAAQVQGCDVDELPTLGEPNEQSIEDFDAVLIRKDPPFDMNYIQLCWILSFAESKVYFMNRPSLLSRYHEKIVPLEAVANGFLNPEDIIPTFFGDWKAAARYFEANKVEKVVVKPFWGFAGSDVRLFSLQEFKAMHESPGFLRNQIVQPFQEEIIEGDRRVFLLDGEILASVVRVPKKGSIVSNLAQGGSAVSKTLRPKEIEVLKKLGKFLKSVGIHLAGADVIGDRISEVNITSPTGIRSIQKLENHDYSKEIIQFAQSCSLRAGLNRR